MKRQKAFTLIELLVVIAIIAILAAILFPVFAQAKEAAKKATCLSHMKQVGVGVHLYLEDTDGVMPQSSFLYEGGAWKNALRAVPANWTGTDPASTSFWVNALQPYCKNYGIFYCPSSKERIVTASNSYPGGKSAAPKITYWFNDLLSRYSESGIQSPSGTPLINDSVSYIHGFAPASNFFLNCRSSGTCVYQPAAPGCDGSSINGVTSGVSRGLQWVHGRGHNVVFSDTHAAYQSRGATIMSLTDPRKDPHAYYHDGKDGTTWAAGQPEGIWMDNFKNSASDAVARQAGGAYVYPEGCHAFYFKPDVER